MPGWKCKIPTLTIVCKIGIKADQVVYYRRDGTIANEGALGRKDKKRKKERSYLGREMEPDAPAAYRKIHDRARNIRRREIQIVELWGEVRKKRPEKMAAAAGAS